MVVAEVSFGADKSFWIEAVLSLLPPFFEAVRVARPRVDRWRIGGMRRGSGEWELGRLLCGGLTGGGHREV